MKPSERIESDPVGRGVISGFLIFLLAALVVWNLPRQSELRRQWLPVTKPFTETLGLDQSWGVFAPNPRREVWYLEGRIRFTDGSRAVWRAPGYDEPYLAPYRAYRWRKMAEQVIEEDQYVVRNLAVWVAQEFDSGRRTPEQVELVHLWRPIPRPGSTAPPEPFESRRIYTLDVTPEILAAVP